MRKPWSDNLHFQHGFFPNQRQREFNGKTALDWSHRFVWPHRCFSKRARNNFSDGADNPRDSNAPNGATYSIVPVVFPKAKIAIQTCDSHSKVLPHMGFSTTTAWWMFAHYRKRIEKTGTNGNTILGQPMALSAASCIWCGDMKWSSQTSNLWTNAATAGRRVRKEKDSKKKNVSRKKVKVQAKKSEGARRKK